MPLFLIILLDIGIFYFFFGNTVLGFLRTKKMSIHHSLKEYEKHFRQLLLRNEDIYSEKHCNALQAAIDELSSARKNSDLAQAENCLKRYKSENIPHSLPPAPSFRWFRDNLEILVVALGLAFGIRALFLQPFKIPTGSMQPTLYGINFEASENSFSGNKLARFFSFLNYSHRYVDIVAQESGQLDFYNMRAIPSLPFFPKSQFSIGNVVYQIPATVNDTQKAIYEQYHSKNKNLYFRKGESVLRGAMVTGDHLFVNRLSLSFREPKRGDVMVFVTDNLETPDVGSFGGRYYIKRLVGMPGDELLIKNHRLYVKEKGQDEFRLLDEKDSSGFRKMYSFQGDYRGYAHAPGARYLKNNLDSFVVPENRYFMLGDNSENSLDSRFWGSVPRENLIGCPLWVWWPFSRRWGPVDRTEPLPIDSPPNLPDI